MMSVNERCPLSVRYLDGFFKGFVLILPDLLTFIRYLEVPANQRFDCINLF